MSFLPRCTSAQKAEDSYRTYGACVLTSCCMSRSWDNALDQLLEWCQWTDQDFSRNPEWFSTKTRAAGADSADSRYSLNWHGNVDAEPWPTVLSNLDGCQVLTSLRASLAEAMGAEQLEVHMCGGDVVKPHATQGQKVHSDGGRPRSRSEVINTPWTVMSIAVLDVDHDNAPLSFWGLDSMDAYYGTDRLPQTRAEAGIDFEDTLICMRRGEILLRNPLVWHCGTRNLAGKTRYLPGVQFKAAN